jgi:hypothetical protein
VWIRAASEPVTEGEPCQCGAVMYAAPAEFDLEGYEMAIRVLRGYPVMLPEAPGSRSSRSRTFYCPDLESANRWRTNAAAHLEAALEAHLRAGTMAVRDALQFRAFLKTLAPQIGALAEELSRAAATLKKQGQATAASRAHVASTTARRLAASIQG